MKHLSPIVTVLWLWALACACCAPAAKADTNSLDDLLAAGRFGEAWELSRGSGGSNAARAAGQIARELLRAAIADRDVYARWYALQAIQALRDPEIAAAARERARSSDRYERALALEYLARVDPAGSRDDLIKGLESPYRSIRVRALRGLMALRDADLGRHYEALLASDPDPDVRALAARALAATGTPEFVPALEDALGDAAAVVQEEAVAALVTLGDPRVVELVRQRLTGVAGPERVRAIRLCARVPAMELIADLGPLLGDGDPEVRTHAAGAILAILEKQRGRTP